MVLHIEHQNEQENIPSVVHSWFEAWGLQPLWEGVEPHSLLYILRGVLFRASFGEYASTKETQSRFNKLGRVDVRMSHNATELIAVANGLPVRKIDVVATTPFASEQPFYLVTPLEWLETFDVSRHICENRLLNDHTNIELNISSQQEFDLWRDVLSKVLPSPTWDFWFDWYRGIYFGNPLEVEIQRRVALIPDPTWDKGPEAVAAEIEKIQALFKLEQDVATLKQQLAASAISPSRIGDNGGPPLDDAVILAVQKDIQLVLEQVAKLETEIAKPEPSPSVLNGIAQRLLEISKRIASYCGEKMDLVLTEAAKETGKAIGKWGAPLAILYATQNESIRSLAQAVKDYVLTLP